MIKAVIAFAVLLLLFSSFALVNAVTVEKKEMDLSSMLPGLNFAPGWERDGDIHFYNRENLYDYINGESALYLPFGFRQLVAASYLYQGDKNHGLTVDIYQMGSRLDAFGIYSQYRSEKSEIVPVGVEGFITDYTLQFYKESYFVNISAFAPSPAVRKKELKLVSQLVAGEIPGKQVSPHELKLFDIPGISFKAVKYSVEEVLGRAFLAPGFTARFQIEKKTVRVFVIPSNTPKTAEERFIKYSSLLQSVEEVTSGEEWMGGKVVSGRDPYVGEVMFARIGSYLIGSVDFPDKKEAGKLFQAMFQKLHKVE